MLGRDRMKNAKQGISVLGVIEIVLIILKVFKLINWSWWVVLCPIWIGLLLPVLFGIVLIIAVFKE